jgi:hypothetical protein
MMSKRKLIGHIGVDAGLCWIGDPCYILHQDEQPKAIGTDWGDFVSQLYGDSHGFGGKQFNYDLGHPGLGVVVPTGYGDGYYPVYAELNSEGRVASVTVLFDDDDNDDSDEEDDL